MDLPKVQLTVDLMENSRAVLRDWMTASMTVERLVEQLEVKKGERMVGQKD
jgi:hypothetical protein